jgi:tRNA pseudouridine38-40 synthase
MPIPPQNQRWKCVCAYDGTGFSGWQSQADGRAVQDVIEAALARVAGAPVRVHGSGRTDAGVHARGQVFHFDAPWRHGPAKLLAALRAGLPPAIQLRSIRAVPSDFHARFSATGKVYTYDLHLGDADPFSRPQCWVIHRPLDLAAMAAAADLLRGRHDFRSFSARGRAGEDDTVRDLWRLDLVRRGRRVRITAEAGGFLYKMVRSLAGALVAVGEGRLTIGRVREILHSRQRTAEIQTAPPQGLFLDKVRYGKSKKDPAGAMRRRISPSLRALPRTG